MIAAVILKKGIMNSMEKRFFNQQGIGGILILGGVLLIIIILVAVFFLLNPRTKEESSTEETTPAAEVEEQISEDQVLFPVCETGEGDDCNDTVPDEAIDSLELDDLP